jgi:hypothetical protein
MIRNRLLFHLVVGLGLLTAQSLAIAAVPTQFIAKMYTEVLGRAPDPTGWSGYVQFFTQNGCSQSTLTTAARQFYLSQEYTDLAYDHVEEVLTLYRGILSREPDAGGFNGWVQLLDQGQPLLAVVNGFLGSREFAGDVNAICNGDGSLYARSYGWGVKPAVKIPTGSSGFQGTAAQLQKKLNAAAATQGTILLAPRALIATDTTIVIPSGVTLSTTGSPDRGHYAHMGRIVRNSLFLGPVVQLEPGAKLVSVWVSGQRSVVGFDNEAGGQSNIFVNGGTGSKVMNSRTDSPAGFSTLNAYGTAENHVICAGVTISGNLSTGYTSHHTNSAGGGWADGISNGCDDATITNNHIVDPTDVGIVLYRSYPGIQQSQVMNNVIVSAGLSAYGAIVLDPLTTDPMHPHMADYTGSFVSNNLFWTSDATHFDIGLSLGTMPWFENQGGVVGTGANVQNNSTPPGLTANVHIGILVDGMLNATVQGNNLQANSLPKISNCPFGNVLADTANQHASGSLQPFTASVVHNCIATQH